MTTFTTCSIALSLFAIIYSLWSLVQMHRSQKQMFDALTIELEEHKGTWTHDAHGPC